jgi:pimeloyl-ACP methyl ester carboxylesterase
MAAHLTMGANPYRGPMAPWPGLAAYGRRVSLADGRQLFIFEAGNTDAPALMLVHGLGDEADSWRHVFGPLAERYHVVAVDLPGFGRSDPARAYNLPALRDALLALLDALSLPSAIFMGNSMGAMLSQMVALQAPGRVSGLVLVDGTLVTRAGSMNWGALMMALPLVGDRIYNGFRRDPQAAYDSLRPFYAEIDGLPEADRSFLFRRVNERVWSDSQRRAYLGLFQDLTWSAPRRQNGLPAALAKIGAPTHLIWGEQDHIMPLAAAQASLALQPAARLVIVPGAGHLPHQERPVAFLEAMLAAREGQPTG